MLAGPVGGIVHRQKAIVAAFRSAGATSRDRATTAGLLGVHEGMAFKILRRHAVLRDAGESRLYLDEPSWEALRMRRRRVGLTISAILVLAAIVILLGKYR